LPTVPLAEDPWAIDGADSYVFGSLVVPRIEYEIAAQVVFSVKSQSIMGDVIVIAISVTDAAVRQVSLQILPGMVSHNTVGSEEEMVLVILDRLVGVGPVDAVLAAGAEAGVGNDILNGKDVHGLVGIQRAIFADPAVINPAALAVLLTSFWVS
jgi:hypothetical protein